MLRLLMSVIMVTAVALSLGGSAQAGRVVTRGGYHNYHLNYGTRFSHGYYYAGQGHSHWSYRYWDARYGRYHYYDPYVNSYYYWHQSHGRYYPVSYAVPTQNVNVVVTQPVAKVVAPVAPVSQVANVAVTPTVPAMTLVP